MIRFDSHSILLLKSILSLFKRLHDRALKQGAARQNVKTQLKFKTFDNKILKQKDVIVFINVQKLINDSKKWRI